MAGELFAPELQLEWSLVELRMPSAAEATVRVEACERVAPPGPLGRQAHDVLSWPDVWTCHADGEFRFTKVLIVSTAEEFAASNQADGDWEGNTFRRYSRSTFMDSGREARPGSEHSVLHYRLVFQNEVLDVVCTTPPNVTLRRFDRSEF